MSIGISDEHVELAASLRKWATSLGGPDAARAAEDDAVGDVRRGLGGGRARWACATIGLPESAGGGGGTTLDVAVALEACAHELVPGPLLGPTVAAAVLGELPEGAVVGLVLGDVVWDAPSATHLLLRRRATGGTSCPGPRPTVELATGLDLTRRFGRLVGGGPRRRRRPSTG